MTDEQVDEAIEILALACNVENRATVTQALRRMVNSGGELMSDDEIDLLADQHQIFGKVNRLRSFARALESRVLAERKPENQQMFALIRDRNYDGEGLTLWTWNGENYSGSDGDCLSRERDGTLDGFEAEFLTDHQLEQRLNAATHPTPDDALDAARYRWLRKGGKDQHDMFDSVWGDTLDAAIDRARKGKESGEDQK